MACTKHWLCGYVNSSCLFATLGSVGSAPAGAIPPDRVPDDEMKRMRALWRRRIDPSRTLPADKEPAQQLADKIRTEVEAGQYFLDNAKNAERARDLEHRFGQPHPGKFPKGAHKDIEERSAGELRAKWSGVGNGFTVKLEASHAQYDMEGPCSITILGEWEWDDFVNFVNEVNEVNEVNDRINEV